MALAPASPACALLHRLLRTACALGTVIPLLEEAAAAEYAGTRPLGKGFAVVGVGISAAGTEAVGKLFCVTKEL